MRLAKFVVAILFSLLVLPAHAGFELKYTPAPAPDPNRQWNIVCFNQDGLNTVLDKIVNTQQFIRNDPWQTISQREFNKLKCDYVQIPKGSQARWVGIRETSEGFIFPIFQVRYSSTGQLMYTADAIFQSKYWDISRSCGRGRYHSEQPCIVPRTCEALDGFVSVSGATIPDYISVPRKCSSYTVM